MNGMYNRLYDRLYDRLLVTDTGITTCNRVCARVFCVFIAYGRLFAVRTP